jgi:hypothetical protein
MKEKVEQALAKIRPALQADGGDVELVDVGQDGTVKVRLKGACGGCPEDGYRANSEERSPRSHGGRSRLTSKSGGRMRRSALERAVGGGRA